MVRMVNTVWDGLKYIIWSPLERYRWVTYSVLVFLILVTTLK